MSNSSTTPCCYCFASKSNLESCGEYSTIGNIKENYEKWSAVGAIKKGVKKYKNCINNPIIVASEVGMGDCGRLID